MKIVLVILASVGLAACASSGPVTDSQESALTSNPNSEQTAAVAAAEPKSDEWWSEVVCRRREHTTATRVGGRSRDCYTRAEWRALDQAGRDGATDLLDRTRAIVCRDTIDC